MTSSDKSKDETTYPDEEAKRRFEKTVDRMLKTPPKPHKPKKERDDEQTGKDAC